MIFRKLLIGTGINGILYLYYLHLIGYYGTAPKITVNDMIFMGVLSVVVYMLCFIIPRLDRGEVYAE